MTASNSWSSSPASLRHGALREGFAPVTARWTEGRLGSVHLLVIAARASSDPFVQANWLFRPVLRGLRCGGGGRRTRSLAGHLGSGGSRWTQRDGHWRCAVPVAAATNVHFLTRSRSPEEYRPREAPAALVPVLIFAAVFVGFLSTLDGQFLNWDDDINFLGNPGFRGLGWAQLRWMWTETLMGHYIPLTWMSLGLNYTLGGMNPWGYHLGNVLIHAMNALVFYFVVRRLLIAGGVSGGSPLMWGAGFAALVFGVHPLRAESVAWITERRDVLCGLFFVLAVLAYLISLDPALGGAGALRHRCVRRRAPVQGPSGAATGGTAHPRYVSAPSPCAKAGDDYWSRSCRTWRCRLSAALSPSSP